MVRLGKGLVILLVAVMLGGCIHTFTMPFCCSNLAHPCLCQEGRYGAFVHYGPLPRYSLDADHKTFWLVHRLQGSRSCLPQHLSIRNLVTPQDWDVQVSAPSWIKGQPFLPVHIQWGALQPKDDVIRFDIFQRDVMKQTVEIFITKDPELRILLDGLALEAIEREGSAAPS